MGWGSARAVGSSTGEAAFVSTVITRGAEVGVLQSARAVGSSPRSWSGRPRGAEPALECSAFSRETLSRLGITRGTQEKRKACCLPNRRPGRGTSRLCGS